MSCHSWKSTINDGCTYGQWQAILVVLWIALSISSLIIKLVFYPHFWQIYLLFLGHRLMRRWYVHWFRNAKRSLMKATISCVHLHAKHGTLSPMWAVSCLSWLTIKFTELALGFFKLVAKRETHQLCKLFILEIFLIFSRRILIRVELISFVILGTNFLIPSIKRRPGSSNDRLNFLLLCQYLLHIR